MDHRFRHGAEQTSDHDDGHHAPGRRSLTQAITGPVIHRKSDGGAAPAAESRALDGSAAPAAESRAPDGGAAPAAESRALDGGAAPAAESRASLDASGRPDLFEAPAPDRFADAVTGRGGELPHRASLERAFGEDFSGVPAHTGRAAALAPMGALAATDGTQVAFADANPSAEVVAHELTHVVQHWRSPGGVQTKSAVAAPDHPAEREADALASRAAAGERVTVSEAPAAAVHRLTTVRRCVIEAALALIETALATPVTSDAPLAAHRASLMRYKTELTGDGTGIDVLGRVNRILTEVRRQRREFAAVVPLARGGENVVLEEADDGAFAVDVDVEVVRAAAAPDGEILGGQNAPIVTGGIAHTYANADGAGDAHFVQFVSQGISYVVGGATRWDDSQINVERRDEPVSLSAPGAMRWYVDAPSGGSPFYDDNSLSRRTPTMLQIIDKPQTSFDRLNNICEGLGAEVTVTKMDVWWHFCTVLVRMNDAGVFEPIMMSQWSAHVPVTMMSGWPVPGELVYEDGSVVGASAGWNALQSTLLSRFPNSEALFGIAPAAAAGADGKESKSKR